MKKVTKILSVMCAVAAASASLTGCKGKDTKDITTVSVWSGSGGGKAVITNMVKEFNEGIGKDNNVAIDITFKEGDQNEQLDLAFKTGQAPDIFITSYLDKYVENGYIAPIEDLPGGEELVGKYSGELIPNIHTYKEKTYCLPQETITFGLVYNKDMFKKAGIVDENGDAKPPQTLDEVIEYAKKLTDNSKREYGIIFPIKWGGFVDYELGSVLQASYGRNEYNPVTGQYDFSVWKKVLEFAKQLKDDGSIYPGSENIDNDAARARFAEGNVGMKFAVSWDTGVLNDQFPAKCDWGVASIPVADINDVYYQKSLRNFGPMINKKSLKIKDVEKLALVYKWMYSEEYEQRLYDECISLPVHAEVVKNANITTNKAGWKEFGELIEISHEAPEAIKTELGNNQSFADMFTNEFWQGTATAEDIINRADKVYNEGIAKYKENNPEYDGELYIKKDWNVKR